MRSRSWGVMSQIRLVLCPLQSELPLPIDLLGTSFQLIERGECNGQLRGLDRFQEAGCDNLVDAIAPHRLAGLFGQLSVGLSALVARDGPI